MSPVMPDPAAQESATPVSPLPPSPAEGQGRGESEGRRMVTPMDVLPGLLAAAEFDAAMTRVRAVMSVSSQEFTVAFGLSDPSPFPRIHLFHWRTR